MVKKVLSYSKKRLKYIITLSVGIFGTTGNNQLILYGYRSTTNIINAGGAQFSVATCEIYGVPQEDMNDVTTLMWTRNLLNQNTIEIYALDDNESYTTLVFAGDIIQAFGYYQNMPDVYLYIQAQNSYNNVLKPFTPTTYNSSVSVATIIQKIALQLGYNFENNGVTAKINTPYLWGSGIEQIRDIAIAAGIDLFIENNTIAICPPGLARTNYTTIISEGTGLVGFPTFDGLGVDLQILFNPSVTFGGSITVESEITRANGTWIVTSISHFLQSEIPDGQWMSFVRGTKNDIAITR
jgi:hypothetical protein